MDGTSWKLKMSHRKELIVFEVKIFQGGYSHFKNFRTKTHLNCQGQFINYHLGRVSKLAVILPSRSTQIPLKSGPPPNLPTPNAIRMRFTFTSVLPMGKSYLTRYLSEVMVCAGPVEYDQEKINSNT